MLYRLGGGCQGGIQHILIVDLAGDFVAFLDDAVDGGAIHALDINAMQLEHLLQTLDLAARFQQMRLEPLLQGRGTGLADHLGQGLHDLVFGIIDVAQRMHKQIIQGLDVTGEQAHGGSPVGLAVEREGVQ